MSDLTSKVIAYWKEEIQLAYDRTRAAVQQDSAARGMGSSSQATSALRALERDLERLMSFTDLAEEIAGDDALALLQVPLPIPLAWKLTPMVPSTAAAFARAIQTT